jgi:cytosine/adenosine deaminase-related metal-dependent hydrolase
MAVARGKIFDRLVVRNAMLVNGRGIPPFGPVDILIENGRISEVVNVDLISLNRVPAPKRPEGDNVIEASGMYVLPGLFDMHVHLPLTDSWAGPKGREYCYKLFLAHGITTIRVAGFSNDPRVFGDKKMGDENKIAAPHMVLMGIWPPDVYSPEEAKETVRKFTASGYDGVKIIGRPNVTSQILRACVEETKAQKMPAGVAIHIAQSCELDARDVAESGGDAITLEHTYGIPEASMPGTQKFPPTYNFSDEVDRFRYDGYVWEEADQYEENVLRVLDTMIELGTAWDPTMVVYEAHRDYERVKTLPWHGKYTVPQLIDTWSPSLGRHATHFFEWKTSDEIAWKRKYRVWMKYLKYFFDNGGIITVGSDVAFIYALYGFATIRELELLQEAGIHPIDIVKIATTNAAMRCGLAQERGIQKGAPADLCIVNGNPLDNWKSMYGVGVMKYSPDKTKIEPAGGVKWTIKGGALFDCKELLRDCEDYVEEQKSIKGVK